MTEQHHPIQTLAEIETLRDEIATEEAMEAVERELMERKMRDLEQLADNLDEIRRLGLTIHNVHHLGRAADMLRLLEIQLASARTALITVAAECHRAKWQFDLSEDYRPTAAAARDLIGKSFDELHRIGDLATAANDTLKSPPPAEGHQR